MDAEIDLSSHRAYFQTISDELLLDIEQLRPHFFADGTEFKHNYWSLKGAPKESRGVNFETPIAPGVMLTDEPEILHAVKLSTVLVATIPGKELGKVGVQSITRYVNDVVNLIRLLKFKYNLRYISSLNKSVVNQLLKDYQRSVADRLQIKRRVSDFLDALSSEEVEGLCVSQGSNTKPDLNMNEVARRIGISTRIHQSFPVLITRFKEKNGFYVKKPQSRYLEWEQDEAKSPRTSHSLRKEMQNIKKFFAVLARFDEMFHELHRPEDEFFADVSATKFGKSYGVRGMRTKNIPREVMFKLMDRAIRWVVDYSDELLGLRDRASAQYNHFFTGENRGGNEQNRRHYASKRMRHWLTENPVESFKDGMGAPYPITGFDTDFKAPMNKTSISKEQIEQARALIRQGMKQKDAAEQVGVSKASLSRILKNGWAEEGLGLDKVLHCYLPTACLLVIYCFTGRRQIEIESLKAGCCVDSSNGLYINLYSAKVDQKYDYFPVTKLVARAVNILERLSKPVRTENNQGLLQVPTLQGGHFQFWQSKKMNEFADLVEANDVEGEREKWVFSEHQFRRFFAQTYFYKYDAGDLPTLSWHLRHSGFSMTEIYLTDEAFGEVYDEVLAEKVADLLVQGPGTLGQIQQDLMALIENLELQGEKRTERLKKRVKEIGLVMKFVPDGLCFGDTTQFKDRSQCLTKGEIQISSAKPGTCQGCQNLCSFEHSQGAQPIVEISKSPMLQKLQEVPS